MSTSTQDQAYDLVSKAVMYFNECYDLEMGPDRSELMEKIRQELGTEPGAIPNTVAIRHILEPFLVVANERRSSLHDLPPLSERELGNALDSFIIKLHQKRWAGLRPEDAPLAELRRDGFWSRLAGGARTRASSIPWKSTAARVGVAYLGRSMIFRAALGFLAAAVLLLFAVWFFKPQYLPNATLIIVLLGLGIALMFTAARIAGAVAMAGAVLLLLMSINTPVTWSGLIIRPASVVVAPAAVVPGTAAVVTPPNMATKDELQRLRDSEKLQREELAKRFESTVKQAASGIESRISELSEKLKNSKTAAPAPKAAAPRATPQGGPLKVNPPAGTIAVLDISRKGSRPKVEYVKKSQIIK
jgi:hypothetical protein